MHFDRIRPYSFLAIAICLLLCNASLEAKPLDQGSDESSAGKKSVQDIEALLQLVMENHILPPAKQQLILHGAQFAFGHQGILPPPQLAELASQCKEAPSYRDFILESKTLWQKAIDESSTTSSGSDDYLELLYRGMIASIPGGARLIPAKEVQVQEALSENRYVGVGIALSMQGDVPVVSKLIANGPGHLGGMKAQDQILGIDGHKTEGKPLGQVVDELRGPEGSVVRLQLKQPNEKPRTLEIERGVNFIPTIVGWKEVELGEFQFFLEDHPSIAYLRFEGIGASTVHELKKIARELQKQPLSGIILDLRNGGGTLHDTVMVADQLLEACTMASSVSRDNETEYRSQPGSLFKETPMVVLVSETMGDDRLLLASVLSEQKRAVLLGRPRNSPAFVRSTFELPDGGAVVFPSALLKRGDGTFLNVQLPGRDVPQPVFNSTFPSVADPRIAEFAASAPDLWDAVRKFLSPEKNH